MINTYRVFITRENEIYHNYMSHFAWLKTLSIKCVFCSQQLNVLQIHFIFWFFPFIQTKTVSTNNLPFFFESMIGSAYISLWFLTTYKMKIENKRK
jgi:hypothetical protein